MWQLKIAEKIKLEKFDFRYLRIKKIIGLVFISFCFLFLILSLYLFLFTPKIIKISPKENSQNVGLQTPIEIYFNRPINRGVIENKIEPEIEGQWQYSGNLLPRRLYTKVIFIPDQYFLPEKEYKITLQNITNVYKIGKSGSFQFNFKTKSVPKIANASIKDGQGNVNINDLLEIDLDQKNDNIVDFDFRFEPEVDFTIDKNKDLTKYSLKPKQGFNQGVDYTFSVERRIISKLGEQNKITPEKVYEIKFRTKDPPGIINYSPKGQNISVDTNQIDIVFKEAMSKEEVEKSISLNPNLKGSWYWKSDQELVFDIGERLNYETTYNVKIPKGTHDLKNGFLTDDLIISFTTIGHVRVSNFSPRDGSGGVAADTAIKVNFNQTVDQASTVSHFIIDPSIDGDFSWDGDELIFQPKMSLSKDSNYTVTISPGVKSINGLDSNEAFSASFQTEESSTILDVPYHHQIYALSCEAAALQMALNYKGVGVSEDDIMAIVGYDPTLHEGNVWGDPDQAYVGDINGRQNTTGYGVHWSPIAAAANHFRSAQAFSGWGAADLAREISAGNPIVIWGVYGNGYYDPWFTPAGKQINAWKGEHARTVIGFTGNVNDPQTFIINDPYAGRITWSQGKLLSNWGAFGNSGVVVR